MCSMETMQKKKKEKKNLQWIYVSWRPSNVSSDKGKRTRSECVEATLCFA